MATVVSIDGSDVAAPTFQIDEREKAALVKAGRQVLAAIAELERAERMAAGALRHLEAAHAPVSDDYAGAWGPWAHYVKTLVEMAAFTASDLEQGCDGCSRGWRLDEAAALLELAESPLHGLDEYGRPAATLSKRARELVNDTEPPPKPSLREQIAALSTEIDDVQRMLRGVSGELVRRRRDDAS